MENRFVFKGRSIGAVGFFGLGVSTLAVFDYLKNKYPYLRFILRSDAPCKAPQGFSECFFGDRRYDLITEDILFFSPSARRSLTERIDAETAGVIFSSDVEFFFENKKIPVLAVTGTDGKSTTVTLASAMISSTVGRFPTSANIGAPMTSLLGEDGILGTVAELSSFQLNYFAPRCERALITNVSENHLDWHTSFEEYKQAKKNILLHAEKRIFNLDCGVCSSFIRDYPAYAVYSTLLTLGDMKKICDAEHYFSLRDGMLLHSGEPIFPIKDLALKGSHNLSNFLAAVALSWEIASLDAIRRTAREFSGLSHRAELIGTYDGISFYDSSIDSTPARTRTTLSSFSVPTVLILGGRGKNLSYKSLFPINKSLKAVIITGENRADIQKELFVHKEFVSGKIPVYYSDDFSDATELAIKCAKAGDAVLLSPASTSFDRFLNYKQRGKVFSDIIKKHYAVK